MSQPRSTATVATVGWDPQAYLSFAGQRARPYCELVARIGAGTPRRVADLGCGPGHMTELLERRWPDAEVYGLDSSPEMVADARSRGIAASLGNLQQWRPDSRTDVVVCNAVLHWIPQHRTLLRGWLAGLPPGAWLAMQVPGNFRAPSHTLARDVAEQPAWRALLAGHPDGETGVLGPDAVDSPAGYASLLAGPGAEVDCWETSYLHALTGEDPVLDWITGSTLRPVYSALGQQQWQRFRAELAPLLRAAYPPDARGVTWFEFRRIFAVVRITGPDGSGG